MEYVGIDVSVKTCSASVVNEAGGIKKALEFANEPSGWRQLRAEIEPGAKVALEAGTAAYPLYEHLVREGFDVMLADPNGVRVIAASRSKTDAKDAAVLAQLLRLDYLPRAYVPPPEVMRARELLRALVAVGQELTRTKNRVHALLTKSGLRPEYRTSRNLFASRAKRAWLRSVRFGDARDAILAALLLHLDGLEAERAILKAEAARIALPSRDVGLLMSIPGVDFYAALLIVSEIGDVRRFRDADALCAYAGLVPSVRQSADVVAHGRITKRGPGTLRWILGIVAEVVVRHDNPMRTVYRRLVRRKKKRALALTAIARHLLRVVYAMLTRGERCRWEDPRLTDLKIQRMRRACARRAGEG